MKKTMREEESMEESASSTDGMGGLAASLASISAAVSRIEEKMDKGFEDVKREFAEKLGAVVARVDQLEERIKEAEERIEKAEEFGMSAYDVMCAMARDAALDMRERGFDVDIPRGATMGMDAELAQLRRAATWQRAGEMRGDGTETGAGVGRRRRERRGEE